MRGKPLLNFGGRNPQKKGDIARNRLTAQTNNGEILVFTQTEDDGIINMSHWDAEGNITNGIDIPSSDMVMLYNLYRYVKENDIRNDFINPTGKNKED